MRQLGSLSCVFVDPELSKVKVGNLPSPCQIFLHILDQRQFYETAELGAHHLPQTIHRDIKRECSLRFTRYGP